MKHVILAFALMGAACATSPPAPPADTYAYVSETLAPGVHLMRQREPFHVQPRGNVGIIEQRDGVVLVDSGGTPAGAEEVIAVVQARTTKPVTAIILTHWHGDHVLGVSRLLQEWPGARLISTEATARSLTRGDIDRFMPGDNAEANAQLLATIQGGVRYLQGEAEDGTLMPAERAGFAQAAREYAEYGMQMARARRVPPTETFAERIVLPDARNPVEALFLGRANTDGDAIIWLPRQRVLFTGDTLVSPIPYGFGSYPTDWIGVLDRMKALEPAVIAPGHGAVMRDSAYLDRVRGLLVRVRAQAAGEIDLSRERAGFVGEDPWLVRWFDQYWTAPISDSARKELRGEPILQGG